VRRSEELEDLEDPSVRDAVEDHDAVPTIPRRFVD
jgi:glutaredoxin-related protein